MKKWLLIFGFFLSSMAHAASFPLSEWPIKILRNSSESCKAFWNFVIADATNPGKVLAPSKKDDNGVPLYTEGLVIVKNGTVVEEWYDGEFDRQGNPIAKENGNGYYRETPHALWSESKTLTATLLAAAINNHVSYKGQIITLETPLSLFFPTEERRVTFGSFSKIKKQDRPDFLQKDKALYSQIKLKNLVEMSSDFEWDESYESGITTSSFLPMLYVSQQKGGGLEDMAKYALQWPMRLAPYAPGNIWNYSGGNANIIQAVLKKIYGEEKYKTLPWDLLYSRIGIKASDAVWERDGANTFVGSSYAMLTPRAMARIGYLYLNKGKWQNDQILDPQWIQDAQIISPAVTDADSQTTLETVKKEGIFSKRMFWLNQAVTKGSETYGPEFPDAPHDMYFAAGHYGQLIIILPTQNMIIARTGSDPEYWSKVNKMTSLAISCYGGKENL